MRFVAHSGNLALFLTDKDTILRLVRSASRHPGSHNQKIGSAVLHLRPIGRNAHVAMRGEDPMRARVNYFMGRDPANWHTDIPTYAKVRERQVWRGVDLVWYGSEGQLECDFVLQPGADPRAIKLAIEGADSARAERDGSIAISTRGREMRLLKPVVYQTIDGMRHRVDGSYLLRRRKPGIYQLAFQVADYDRARALVIDPVITYLTYLGGTGAHTQDGYDSNSATGIVTDSSGNLYLTGGTYSLDLPVTANAYTPQLPYSASIYVSEINPNAPAASQLIYSSYFPADGQLTAGNLQTASIAVDSKGRIHLATNASSRGFPVSANAFQRSCPQVGKNCKSPAYAVIDPSLSGQNQLVYATFVGGSNSNGNNEDIVNAMAVDPATEHAYLTGITQSGNFPVTSTAYSQSCANGCPNGEVFLAVLDPTQSGNASLIYSTYLGGSQTSEVDDSGYAVAVDGSGRAYLTGFAGETDFPVTANAFQSTCSGSPFCNTSFISLIDPSESGTNSLVYSSYLFNDAQTGGIAVDSNDDVYVAGIPGGANTIQTTTGAFQAACPNASAFNCGFFVTKMDLTRTPANQLVYSTYVAGTTFPYTGGYFAQNTGIAVDSNHNAIVAGPTGFSDFPTPNGLVTSCPNGCSDENDVVFVLNSTGTALDYGTYLGGSNGSNGYWVATNSNGDAYVAGSTGSSDFPVSSNALDATCVACAGSGSTGFVSELNPAASGSASLLYSSFVGGSGRPEYFSPGPPEVATSMAVDNNGDAFIVGDTNSIDFPVVGGLPSADQGVCPGDTSNCPGAAFVAKFAPAGNGDFTLVYSTYLGGNAKTSGNSIAIDGLGDAYIAGATESTTGHFPLVNAYQSACPACANSPAGSDGYVAELNPNGNGLLYSTYFGSVAGTPISAEITNVTSAVAIGLDNNGNIFFTGGTDATDLPTTTSAFQSNCPALVDSDRPCNSTFLAELNPSLTDQLVYSSFMSGTTATSAAAAAENEPLTGSIGLAVDSKGKPYISGTSNESDLPTTTGVLNTGPCAAADCGFVAKFDTTQSGAGSLVYSTLLTGSTGITSLARLAVDSAGDAYVTGGSIASDYPVKNGYQGTCPDCVNERTSAVVSELNPTAGGLIYSTYLGGTSDPYLGIADPSEVGVGIGVTSSGNIVVSGISDSDTFPLSADAFNPCPGSFVTELNPNTAPANQLVFSSCLDNATDFAVASAIGSAVVPFDTSIYIAGGTASAALQVTADAFQNQCHQCTFDAYNGYFGVLAPQGAVTETPTPTSTATGSPSPTATATATGSTTPTATSSASATATSTPTISATATPTRSATQTPTATASSSPTATATATVSPSPTPTATSSTGPTQIPTPTSTPTSALGGDAALIDKGSSVVSPGSSSDLGTFQYSPSDTGEQVVSSATVSVSRPGIFTSLTLTASLGVNQVGSTTVTVPDITSTTVFTFSPPLTIPSGGGISLSFELSGTIAPHQLGSLDNVRLAGIASFNSKSRFSSETSLTLALAMFGFAILPLGIRTRRRATFMVASLIVLSAALAGCGGSSGAPATSESSTQKITLLAVTENEVPVGVSGLPIDLGTITVR